MVKIAIWLLTSLVSGILYRFGGQGKPYSTLYRDIGCSLIIIFNIELLSGFNLDILQWVSLLLVFGLQCGALSSYRYFLPKPKNYKWYHYSLHGLMISLATIPFNIISNKWIGFTIRTILLPILLGVWYLIAVNNDILHERGRGVILGITSPLIVL